jgi:HSP20 family protein
MVTAKEKEKTVPVRRTEPRGLIGLPADFERIMRDYFGPWRGFLRTPLALRREMWIPDIDVLRQEDKLVVRADLPGMKREDIDVSLEDNMLFIRGKRREEKEVKEEDYYFAERSLGTFSRALSMPEGVKAEAIQATYKDGVLEIVIPVPARPEANGTKIKVK